MDRIEGEGQDSIGLLDVLVLMAQDIRLLIGLPIAIGVLAYAATFLVPHGYVSEAILAVPAPNNSTAAILNTQTPVQAAALMVSAVVLDPVVESLGLAADRPVAAARSALAADVEAKVLTDGFLHLSVSRDDSAESIAVCNAIIDSWLRTTVPSASERTELEQRLAFSKVSLLAVEESLKDFANQGALAVDKSMTRVEAGSMVVTLGQLQARYLNDVLVLPKLMVGSTRDIVRQTPTLVVDGSRPMRGLIAASVALSAGAVLLGWLFLRRAWRLAASDPQAARKQQMLVAALRFGKAGR